MDRARTRERSGREAEEMAEVHDILQAAIERGGSDVFIVPGSCVRLKVAGEVQQLLTAVLQTGRHEAADQTGLRAGSPRDGPSYRARGRRFFVFHQRRRALSLQRVSAAQLSRHGAARGLARRFRIRCRCTFQKEYCAWRTLKKACSGHRPSRKRKIDHACLHHRPDQHEPARAHHHD